jgi:hypothetical protein
LFVQNLFGVVSEHRVEHTKRFDEAFLPRAPLAQFLESDKAVMVHIDFLHHQSNAATGAQKES